MKEEATTGRFQKPNKDSSSRAAKYLLASLSFSVHLKGPLENWQIVSIESLTNILKKKSVKSWLVKNYMLMGIFCIKKAFAGNNV